MNIKYPLLIPVIGHGAPDIVDFPFQTIFYNILSSLLVYNLNIFQRKTILVLFSIFHTSQDIPNKIILNSKNSINSKSLKILDLKYNKYVIASLFHGIMIKKPLIAKLYFLLLHTPIHYLRIIKTKIKVKEKLLVGLATSIISMFLLNKDYDNKIEKKMGKLWWIFPIFPHIYLTHIFNNIYIKIKKYNYIKINKIHVI
tara:strand:- start:5085 stop:5681 length:597 start_codon:yes stop_codon:yes gene_type:complete